MNPSDTQFALPRSTPESQGVASDGLITFLEEAQRSLHDLHSIMVVRHGHVVAEGWWTPYLAPEPHMLFSLSKSFCSTAAGLAVAEGLLSLDDPVIGFFPEDVPETISPNLAAMRVRHLLSMSTGHEEDTTGYLRNGDGGSWVKGFLARPVDREPGTHFVYNSGATYMVSAIVQKVTGQRLLDYLTPRLLEPLGITGAWWDQSPEGIDTGGWGLNVTTEDIAKFGLLYLQDGVWNGTRLLPEGWVADATRSHISNGDNPESDWNQGYGFQFWRSRYGAYRGDGAFGQYCVVIPEKDATVAITGGIGDMQAVLNVLWTHVLPALGDAALPENADALSALQSKLGTLCIPPPPGASSSPLASQVSGRTITFEPAGADSDPGGLALLAQNDDTVKSATLTFDEAGAVLSLINSAGSHTIRVGSGTEWVSGHTSFGRGPNQPIAALGAWTSDDTYVVKLSYTRTPFIPTLTFRFEGDRATLDYRENVSFGPAERPQLVGWLA
jgi:CubicO group peptidase (beta-lactamase class C family)